MKLFNFFNRYTILLCAIVGISFFSSCDDSDKSSGPPEITGVRVTDPAKADSLFAQMPAGRMIVIVGKNLQNAQKVFINDQEVSFNANYNTATHIIVSIPSEADGFVLTYDDPTLKPEIRVETKTGVARFQFTVSFPFPEITSLNAENYPIPNGDRITVLGSEFMDVKSVYFTNIDPNVKDKTGEVRIEVRNYTITNDDRVDYVLKSRLEFVLPDLPRDGEGNYSGYFVIECVAAPAVFNFRTFPEPLIESISSDMPIPGMKVTINGKFFVDVEYIDINNGEIVILAADMEESTREKIVFTMPAKPSKSGNLKIVAFNGEGILKNFYPYEQLLTDFDEIGKYENWSATQSDLQFVNADTTDLPYSDGAYVHMYFYGRDSGGWGTALAMHKDNDVQQDQPPKVNLFPSFDYIPAKTPSSEVYLAYECYNKYPFDNLGATVRYQFLIDGTGANTYHNYDWNTEKPKEVCHPGYDGVPLFNQWYTVTVPLSKFEGLEDVKYEDICNSNISMLHFLIINFTNSRDRVDISFDNVRFITKPK